jgi:hypothetical protein
MSGVLTNTFFDMIEQQLLDLLARISAVLQSAGIPHRVVGGMAVYLHVSHAEKDAGRLTRDIDIAVNRSDLERIAQEAAQHGFEYRHAAGVDMLLDPREPGSRRAVHIVFASEKVRPEYVEPVPGFERDPAILNGSWLMPVEELIRMKLTSFQDKDRVHVRDMDEVGLITPDIEASLQPVLRERLAHIRATE